MKFWLFLGFWANFDGCGKFRTNFEKSDPKSFHDFPKGVLLPKIKLIAQRMPKNSKDNPGENLVLGSFSALEHLNDKFSILLNILVSAP